MAVCPVCGCKTDELDFVKGSVGNWNGNICSFCHKQLSGFGDTLTEAQVRWVGAVLSKDVSEREDVLLEALKSLSGDAFSPVQDAQYPKVTTYAPQGRMPVSSADVNDETIKQLLSRIEALEKQIKAMKRSSLIKSILEVCIPIILGIIILIVFFSSGLFDALSGLYNQFK